MQLKIARLGKAHGVRGEVTVELLTDQPEERFYPGALFSLLSPAPEFKELNRKLTLESAYLHNGKWILAFEAIENRNKVEELRNHFIAADIDVAHEGDGEDEFHVQQLIGLTAVDGEGNKLGEVKDILNLPGQDVVVINIDGKEKLVPFVYEFVPTIDIANKIMVINPPVGLLEDEPLEVDGSEMTINEDSINESDSSIEND
jgi:16S rRNA processing protein RimM